MSVFLLICSVILLVWAFSMPPSDKDHPVLKNYKKIVFLVIAVAWFVGSIWDIDDRQSTESTLKSERDSLKTQVDTIVELQKKLTDENKSMRAKMDSMYHVDTFVVQQKGRPRVTVCIESPYNRVVDSANMYFYSVELCNRGDLYANVKVEAYYIVNPTALNHINKTKRYVSQSFTIAPSAISKSPVMLNDYMPKVDGVNIYFMFLRLQYADNNGKSYNTERIILEYNNRGRPIFSLTGPSNFEAVKKVAIEGGAW